MTTNDILSLEQLEFFPYLNEEGSLREDWQGKIGVYAIFDEDKTLQYIGYSRDIYLSLKQHLIRQMSSCYWLKLQIVTRPSRTLLEEIRQAWIGENKSIPLGNIADKSPWTEPIDAKVLMSASEKEEYLSADELGQIKLLKKVARALETEIQTNLKNRGITMDLRFNPKLKEEGLLDLK
jgi:hypothetical protein